MIDAGDDVLVEDPSYLVALQTFHIYNPNIRTVSLNEDGANLEEFKESMNKYNHKLFYSVPTFQNPTGITYTSEVREKIAEIMKGKDTFLLKIILTEN